MIKTTQEVVDEFFHMIEGDVKTIKVGKFTLVTNKWMPKGYIAMVDSQTGELKGLMNATG